MKIGLVSDLHFEFHRDGGGSLVADLSKDCDVLVAAGDIAVGEGIPSALKLLCGAFAHVVYLCGNHEYYGSTQRRVVSLIEGACRRHRNLSWLRPGVSATVGAQRFVGTAGAAPLATHRRARSVVYNAHAGLERGCCPTAHRVVGDGTDPGVGRRGTLRDGRA